MTKRMLIDDTQKEETRVVILDGNKIEDVEFESSSRKQIKGNIYTAKVVRIEPSLQAAFIDYGGNKHGFLAFSERLLSLSVVIISILLSSIVHEMTV